MPIFARRNRHSPHAHRRSHLTRHEIDVAGLPPALDGLRVAHLTDVHVQRMVRPRHLDRAVDVLNELQPELTFLTGDYVCFHPGAIPRLAESLSRLRLPRAPVAVLGNHDHWCDGPRIRRTLEDLGIDVLQNEHRQLEVRGERLVVVGVDDASTGRADPEAAFAGVPEAPILALTHDPRVAPEIASFGAGLILAGHTHGGQIKVSRLTGRLAARLGHHHLEGFFEIGSSRLFVNRGLGHSLPPRVNAPREVALLQLRNGSVAVDRAASAR